jgi:hypothetical protein
MTGLSEPSSERRCGNSTISWSHCPHVSSNCWVGLKPVLVFVKPPGRGCTRRSMNASRQWFARPIASRANLAKGKSKAGRLCDPVPMRSPRPQHWNQCPVGQFVYLARSPLQPVGASLNGRLSMGRLMLRCPMTDRNFSAGIDTDSETLRLVLDARITAHCPYCGQDHSLRPRDAWLAESIPLRERTASVR